MLVVGAQYTFGELKAGDKFAYRGVEWEKISGNMADLIVNGKVKETKEIPADAPVILTELW